MEKHKTKCKLYGGKSSIQDIPEFQMERKKLNEEKYMK